MTRTGQIGVIAAALCFGAAGAGGTWYLTRPMSLAPTPGEAAVIHPRPVHTVSWFKAHRAGLAQQIIACSDNPGVGTFDPDCENAAQAKEEIDTADFLASAPR